MRPPPARGPTVGDRRRSARDRVVDQGQSLLECGHEFFRQVLRMATVTGVFDEPIRCLGQRDHDGRYGESRSGNATATHSREARPIA